MNGTSLDVAMINRNAIGLLVKGDYHQSLLVSRRALEMIQNILQRPLRDPAETSVAAQNHSSPSSGLLDLDLDLVDQRRISTVPLPGLQGIAPELISHGAFELFNRALLVQDSQDLLEDATHNITLAVVILYNTALCHHIRGLQFGNSRELTIALRMYRMALQLFNTGGGTNNATADDYTVLPLALYNNMGHLFSCGFSDLQQSVACLASMDELFSSVNEEDLLSGEDYLFFSMASLPVTNQSFVAAPSA